MELEEETLLILAGFFVLGRALPVRGRGPSLRLVSALARNFLIGLPESGLVVFRKVTLVQFSPGELALGARSGPLICHRAGHELSELLGILGRLSSDRTPFQHRALAPPRAQVAIQAASQKGVISESPGGFLVKSLIIYLGPKLAHVDSNSPRPWERGLTTNVPHEEA
eukprot:6468214-Pyramimonas_sp.AAC.1